MAKKKEPVTEIAVIDKPEIKQLVSSSGIELTKAEAHVKAFSDGFEKLSELSRPLAGLNKESPTKEDAKIARETRLKIVKVRTRADEIKDDLKRTLLTEASLIQGIFNTIKASCELTEDEYLKIEKHEEKLEKERIEKLIETRTELLKPYETETDFLPLGNMSDEQFDRLLAKEKESFVAVTEARAKAEKERQEAEELAETLRIADEKAKQLFSERFKVVLPYASHVTQDSIDSLGTISEKEFESLSNAAKKAKEESDKKAAADKLQAEETNKKLKEANEKLKKEQDEAAAKQKAIDDAAADKAKKEAELLKAPDQEKVRDFFEKFKALKFPEMQSENGKAMALRVNEALEMVKKLIIADSKTLM